jgi:hypothetical protein
MANALTFIESNIEDLDADQKKEKIRENLKQEIERMSKDYPKFPTVSKDLLERKIEVQELLLQVLSKSD